MPRVFHIANLYTLQGTHETELDTRLSRLDEVRLGLSVDIDRLTYRGKGLYDQSYRLQKSTTVPGGNFEYISLSSQTSGVGSTSSMGS